MVVRVVNRAGFDPMGGEAFAPGSVFVVTADGAVRGVAEDIAFPNGMAVTHGNSTLIVADSYRHSLVAFGIGADGGLSNHLGPSVPSSGPAGLHRSGGTLPTTPNETTSR